jgi:lipopolysaccharide biosynthesis glycosyltransferase
MINIFIGYDTKETVAYHVCVNSVIRHARQPVSITPLALSNLTDYSETHIDASNQFTYTRFLVPHFMDYRGCAIFVDGDMILQEDIAQLYNLFDPKYAVQVVKHNYKTKQSTKYLGAKNEDYPRKNWSSVMLWNCAHSKNKILTPEFVQHSSGSQLHRFTWLSSNDIGELPIEWNWLSDEYGVNNSAKLIHYTLGTPCFEAFANTPMSDAWHNEFKLAGFFS